MTRFRVRSIVFSLGFQLSIYLFANNRLANFKFSSNVSSSSLSSYSFRFSYCSFRFNSCLAVCCCCSTSKAANRAFSRALAVLLEGTEEPLDDSERDVRDSDNCSIWLYTVFSFRPIHRVTSRRKSITVRKCHIDAPMNKRQYH